MRSTPIRGAAALVHLNPAARDLPATATRSSPALVFKKPPTTSSSTSAASSTSIERTIRPAFWRQYVFCIRIAAAVGMRKCKPIAIAMPLARKAWR